MRRAHKPDSARKSGLSTEDLARPREGNAEEATDARRDAPMFPGESTGSAGSAPGTPAGRSSDTPAATRSETPTRTPPDTAADRTPGSGTDAADSGTAPTATDPAARPDTRTQPEETHAPSGDARGDDDVQLLSPRDEEGFRARWQETQSQFVDDPRDAVHSADALVADVMQELASTFADHKRELEDQWNRGEQADTEDLRLALRHYRSFFNRLLAA
ncbi:hypothetical protein [Streptomyces sp. 142MFCol3.1]|uniref:hypothetical protein n=1 Tax=Streptomyces sp. 142MFCol3.1 TaxID=1172179 RepID=UPI00041A43EF|nr:hypothetical protein [Streptomyces sp. 142MFCol3.1]